MAIRHIVLFDFRHDADETDVHEIISRLNKLPEQISEIRAWEVRPDLGRREHSHRYALVADFDSMEAVNRYLEHPLHVRAVEQASPLITRLAEHDHEI